MLTNNEFYYITVKSLDFYSLFSENYNFDHSPIYLRLFYAFCDVFVARKLNSQKYLEYAFYTPSDYSSLENLLQLLAADQKTAYFKVLIEYSLLFLNSYNTDKIFLADLVTGKLQTNIEVCDQTGNRSSCCFKGTNFDYETQRNHLPCLNGFWFLHINMISQYSSLYNDLIFLISKNFTQINQKLLLVFKPRVTFINYLLFIHNSPLIPVYFTIYLFFIYHLENFYQGMVVGTNFLMWPCSIFTLIYIYEVTNTKIVYKINK
ncbi:hypothetical protein NUSPORA_00414 [Nucleospora cyclopteri]